MKKYISVLLAVLMMVGCLSACGSKNVSTAEAAAVSSDVPASDGKLQIVTTIFPEYDWVMNVLGDNADKVDGKGRAYSPSYH